MRRYRIYKVWNFIKKRIFSRRNDIENIKNKKKKTSKVEVKNNGFVVEETSQIKEDEAEIVIEIAADIEGACDEKNEIEEGSAEEVLATEVYAEETFEMERHTEEFGDDEIDTEESCADKIFIVKVSVEENIVEELAEIEADAEKICEEEIDIEEFEEENKTKEIDEDNVHYSNMPLTRKEKEERYSDDVELMQTNVNPKYLLHLKEIPEVDDYSKLHNRIVREFPYIKLLCEIDISDDEYRLLCRYFKEKYHRIRENIRQSVIDVIFSVALVQIGTRKYDGNYWKHIDDVLGIKVSVPQRAWIGDTLSDTLIVFGKPLFKKQEYVTNILMHCFVTKSFLVRMYDYLFQYYNLDLQRDMAGMNEADLDFLCASIKNPFGMRKQLLSNYTALSLKGNEEYCKNIIYRLLKLIDMSFWNEYSSEIVLPEQFQKEFEEWKIVSNFYKNEKKRMEEVLLSGNREKVYRKPHLTCYHEKGVFEAILPPQMIRDSKENEIPLLTWQIFTEKSRYERKCYLEEGYSGYKTKELKISLEAEEIFGEICFLLFKENTLLRKFSWEKHKINFFDESGNWLAGTSLKTGNCFGYSEMETEVISEALLASSIRNQLKFWEFDFKAGDFVQVGGEGGYYVGEVPDVGLTKEYLCEDVVIFNEKEETFSVYYRPPAYIIDIPFEQFEGTAIFVNGKIERFAEKDFFNVCHAKNDERQYYFLKLDVLENIKSGFNEIVIDIPGSARKLQERFFYIPDFQYKFEDAPYVFQKRGTLSLNRKIENGIIIDETYESMQNDDFSIEDLKDDFLEFSISFDKVAYKMVIHVPMFMYSWDMKNWTIHKAEDIWHTELCDYIYIKYPTDKISLCVDGNNDELRATYVFTKNVNGIFVCDLTKLKTYLYDGEIIKKIKLICGEAEYDMLRVVTKSYLHSVTLETDFETNHAVWKFEISGKNAYYADVFYRCERIVEKEAIIDGKIEAKMAVHSTKYLVKVYEAEEEFGFDDEYDLVGQAETTVLNPMELTDGCMKVNVIQEIDNPINVLEVNYGYYIFIDSMDEEMGKDKHYYIGILAAVFRDSIMSASKVKIHIPNLNDIYHVVIGFVDEYGDCSEFLYDSYKNSINEYENPKFTKSEAYRRYEVLFRDIYVWNIKYINGDSKIKKEATDWIEGHNRKNAKEFRKHRTYDFKNISIDKLDLSTRSYNCLKRAGLLTVGQVIAAYQKGNLTKIRNFGQKNYNEVYSKLYKRNWI